MVATTLAVVFLFTAAVYRALYKSESKRYLELWEQHQHTKKVLASAWQMLSDERMRTAKSRV